MTARRGLSALLTAVMAIAGAAACRPRVRPVHPVAGPVGPAAEARPVELAWKDGETVRRWALVGGLVHVGPDGALPLQYRGEKRIAGASDDHLFQIGEKVVGVDLTGLESAQAVALLGRHVQTVESVVLRRARRLDPEVVRALSQLATKQLVLSVWPAADAPMLDLAPLGALGSKLYGLVLGAEVIPGGLRALQRLGGLRVVEMRVSVRQADLRDLGRLRRLRVLRLRNALGANRLGGEALRPLGNLSDLVALDVSVNDLRDADLEALTPLRGLCWLDVGYNRIDGTGLARLAGMKRLAVLELDGNTINDESLGGLGSRASLRVLRLRKTAVGDEALAALMGLGGLRLLDVTQTQVGDDGLGHLRTLKGLRELRVGQTRVTGKGVAAFLKQHPSCRVRGATTSFGSEAGVTLTASGIQGLPPCQKYMQVLRCYVDKLPAAAQPAMKAALSKTLQSWQQMLAKGSSARSSVARSCRAALKAMRRAVSSIPMFRGCLTP